MGKRRTAAELMQPIPERPTVAAIWEGLSALDDLVRNELMHRLENIERRQERFLGALGFIRWSVPVVVAIAAIVVSRVI